MAASASPSTDTPPAPYQPVAPYSATFSTILSQDVVMTDTILVDSTSPSPAAPFTNPASGGQANTPAVEALVVSGGELGHARRDPGSDAGWSLVQPFNGVAAALEVAAGTAFAGTSDAAVWGLYQDDTTLWSTQLGSDGVTWSQANQVTNTVNSNLRTCYAPNGELIVYGQTTSGDLIVAYQASIGGAFVTQTYSMSSPLQNGDYALCVTSEDLNWTLAANVNGQLWIYTGALDGTSTQPSNGGQADNYDGTISQVVLGYWSPAQAALMFLFVDSSGTLQTWVSTSGTIVPIPSANPNSTVAMAAAHVYVDPTSGVDSINVYTVDGQQNLAVLHQIAAPAWNSDGTPNWAPPLPLDTVIAGLAIDTSPADVPSVFALTGGTYALRLHTQDPSTQMWSTGEVLQSGQTAFEVERYRVEVDMVDANGVPLPMTPVTVAVASGYSAVDVWVAGQTYAISSSQSASLTTDATGKLTMAILTTAGLAAPQLTFTADNLTTPLTIQPAQGIHTYLSGIGPLNPTNPVNPPIGSGPLSPFDSEGVTLSSAVVSGVPLAPVLANSSNPQLAMVAASAIQQTALLGLGQSTIAGYQVTFNGSSSTFEIINSPDEVDARVARLRHGLTGSVWSDISGFASDIWEGIKNGVITVASFVVSCAASAVTFVVNVADEIVSGVDLVVSGLEQAAQFITGVFQAIEADVDQVVDWLKALFDFSAIWQTKTAFEAGLDQMAPYVSSLIQLGSNAAGGWFSQQETRVNDYLTTAISHYQNQAYGAAPSSSTPIGSNATVNDFTNNVHHNWLQDKIAAYAGSSTLGLSQNSTLSTPWQQFTTAVEGADTDFLNGLNNMATALQTAIQHPSQLGTLVIADVLTGIQGLVDGMLALCDAVLQGFMALATAAMEALQTILTTPINISSLQSLWSWIAQQAGESQDTLTISAFLALLAAFPATVIAKLIMGVSFDLYPSNGDAAQMMLTTRLGSSMPAGVVLASAILQTVYVVPGICSSILGNDCPTWLTVGLLGLSGIIWFLASGFPDVSGISWGTVLLVVVNVILMLPILLLVALIVIVALVNWLPGGWNDFTNIVTSIYGLGSTIVHVILDILNPPDANLEAAGLLVPLPSMFTFLNLSAFRDDPAIGPFALAALIMFDVIGYVGGGVFEVIDAVDTLTGTSSSVVPA